MAEISPLPVDEIDLPTEPEPAVIPSLPLRLNRNLLNFPIARDARTTAKWWRGNKTGRWQCDLPGDDRIQFWLPADTPEAGRRLPTGLDMNLLFVLLAELARTTGKAGRAGRVEWASSATLLRALGLSAHTDNRKRLLAALELWSRLSIRFQHWYVPANDKSDAERVRRVLPPPISAIEKAGRRVIVTLDEDWQRLPRDGYYQQVPVPLPNDAAAQNALLLILTSAGRRRHEQTEIHYARGQRNFCRKIGLNHAQRNLILERALAAATEWVAAHGGELWTGIGPAGEFAKTGEIASIMWKPPLIPGVQMKTVTKRMATVTKTPKRR